MEAVNTIIEGILRAKQLYLGNTIDSVIYASNRSIAFSFSTPNYLYLS
jgi:hypothetical protein